MIKEKVTLEIEYDPTVITTSPSKWDWSEVAPDGVASIKIVKRGRPSQSSQNKPNELEVF